MQTLSEIGQDTIAVDYIKTHIKPDGIMSTRSNLLRHGRRSASFWCSGSL